MVYIYIYGIYMVFCPTWSRRVTDPWRPVATPPWLGLDVGNHVHPGG